MSSQLVECIANFSEGQNSDVIQQIIDAIKSVKGTVLLDQSSDPDHNRSVITFAGNISQIEESAFRAIEAAANLIDMNTHEGEHPRLGATDVCPFVPISGVTMADCVKITNRLGERVGNELNIPVYLYEAAAKTPGRVNLAKVRKGEYELLKEEIEINPARKPDFGPEKIGSAGATVIGAREALVAYNVYLNNDDVEAAKAIGKAVRHSSGGLRYVKALGMLVDGKAQVSMNLTNFNKTPIYRVQEMIRREAQRYGAEIRSGEIIGLIPQKALDDSAEWYLQLEGFDSSQILENKIKASTESPEDPLIDAGFIDALASNAPTPGGGSASAYASSMAAGLCAMVCRLTIGKKKYLEVESEMQKTLDKALSFKDKLTASVIEDSAAFDEVMNAYRLPKVTSEDKQLRAEAIQAATLAASKVPLSVMEISLSVMKLAKIAVELGNINAITDAGAAGSLAFAGLTGAGLNVKINTQSLIDKNEQQDLVNSVEQFSAEASQALASIEKILSERANL